MYKKDDDEYLSDIENDIIKIVSWIAIYIIIGIGIWKMFF